MISASGLVEKFRYALDNRWGYIWGTAGVMWTQAKQNQKVKYMVDKYGSNWQKNSDAKNDNYYMAALYGSKWIGHTVADCSGLFKWAFNQLGGSIAHGSNSIYDRYCSMKGKITDDIRKTMLPGTAVFVDKNGDKSHIGLYVGNGKVIEEASTQAGACTSNLTAGKWTYFGRLKGVSYSSQNAPEQPSSPSEDKSSTQSLPTLKRGSKGEYVSLLQTMLANKGYSLGSCGVDGDFGTATEKAVKAFQKTHDGPDGRALAIDGVVGPATWWALQNAVDGKKPVEQETLYTVTIKHLTKDQADALKAQFADAVIVSE